MTIVEAVHKSRCEWCNKSELYQRYHDEEWGRPVHDDQRLFEFLLLECMQAGLSWYTILQRRENYRQAFANFEVAAVAAFSEDKVNELVVNPGIIRHRKKIEAAINNARLFIVIQQQYGSFDNYIWGFTQQQVVVNQWQSLKEIPAVTPLAETIARDLKQRGFKFVGATTIYAFLQAIGVVDDHVLSCWRRARPES